MHSDGSPRSFPNKEIPSDTFSDFILQPFVPPANNRNDHPETDVEKEIKSSLIIFIRIEIAIIRSMKNK
jgi:hypothetical protein